MRVTLPADETVFAQPGVSLIGEDRIAPSGVGFHSPVALGVRTRPLRSDRVLELDSKL